MLLRDQSKIFSGPVRHGNPGPKRVQLKIVENRIENAMRDQHTYLSSIYIL